MENVLSEHQEKEIQGYCQFPVPLNWKDFTLSDAERLSDSAIGSLLLSVSKFFDLSSMIGFEYWVNYNAGAGWHYDTDESNTEGKFPICSIVYYPKVDLISGGHFITEQVSIKPKQNSLLCFSPGIHHCVEKFEGQRVSLAINPWSYKVKSIYV